jgi:hypothetical protein
MRPGIPAPEVRFAVVVCLFAVSGIAGEIPSQVNVSVSRQFFNPSIGETVQITVGVPEAGRLTVLVLDRDGFLVRTLARDQSVSSRSASLVWDGTDNHQEVLPDEAYSLKIHFAGRTRRLTYFPARATRPRREASRRDHSIRGPAYSPMNFLFRVVFISRQVQQSMIAMVDLTARC